MIKISRNDYTYGFEKGYVILSLSSKFKAPFKRELDDNWWTIYIKRESIESELIKELRG